MNVIGDFGVVTDETGYDLSLGGTQTYTVRKISQLWSVSYKVSIKSNKIKSVSSLKTTVYMGKISKSFLIKISSLKARWTGTYTHYIRSNLNCTATVKNES